MVTGGIYYNFHSQLSQPRFLKSSLDNQFSQELQFEWNHWKNLHEKSYSSESENYYRLSVFNANKNWIEANKPPATESYRIGLNKFADLTKEEFRSTYLNKQPQTTNPKKYVEQPTASIPDSKNWVFDGALTGVKDQGQCGSCWAFSVAGALESLNKIQNGDFESLSEQQLMDCSKSYGNLSCGGGYMDKAYDYVKDAGIMSLEDYSYEGHDSKKCFYDKSKVKFNIKGHYDVPLDDSDQLKAAIARQPVSVGINAEILQFYVDGVWSDWDCSAKCDHAVLAAGYDIDILSEKKYWLLKNSWGVNWGENGYFRFERRDGKGVGMCGITKQGSYPVG